MGPLGKVHNTAVHIQADNYWYNMFKKCAGRVLGLDNDSRWNSWFLLLNVTLEKQDHVKWYQDKHWEGLGDDYLTPKDWQILHDTCDFLQPFWKITRLTEGYKVTLDTTLFTIDILHKHYQLAFKKFRNKQQLLGCILTSWYVFDKYYQLSDENPIYAAALILHPSQRKAHILKIGQDPGIERLSTVLRHYGRTITKSCQVKIQHLLSYNYFQMNMSFLLENLMLWAQMAILMNMKPSPHRFLYQLTAHHLSGGFVMNRKATIQIYQGWQLMFFQFLRCLPIPNVFFLVHDIRYHGIECSLELL